MLKGQDFPISWTKFRAAKCGLFSMRNLQYSGFESCNEMAKLCILSKNHEKLHESFLTYLKRFLRLRASRKIILTQFFPLNWHHTMCMQIFFKHSHVGSLLKGNDLELSKIPLIVTNVCIEQHMWYNIGNFRKNWRIFY